MGAGRNQSFRTMTLENGGSITSPGTANLNVSQSFNARSGFVGVKLVGNSELTKTTDGTAHAQRPNTYIGGTNVSAGTLRVKRLHENNAVNITGGKLQVMDSSPDLPDHPSGDNAFVSRPVVADDRQRRRAARRRTSTTGSSTSPTTT